MRRFLKHSVLFLILVILSSYIVLYMADGKTDMFYLRFTSSKKSSLIVGSSRSAQALQPMVLNKELTDAKFYNYSFSLLHSPYGEAYYRSIKNKLDEASTGGRFLVSVDPWVISSKTSDPNDSLNFRELGSFIDKVDNVNYRPNFEYFIESFSERKMKIFTNKNRVGQYETSLLHDDGWLEVDLHLDSLGLAALRANKMNAYKDKLREYSGFSTVRFSYLNKIIELFKKHGTVYLVRLPVCDEMQDLEAELIPDFNSKMETLASEHSIHYLNMMNDWQRYSYTDGHHLERHSGAEFSKMIAKKIRELENE